MSNKSALIINGKLLANGTDGQPITVTPENDSSSWKYFKFTDSSMGSSLSYCNFDKGGYIEATEESGTIIVNKTEITVNNCNISNSLSNGILYTASTGNIIVSKLNVYNSNQSGARISLPTVGDPVKLNIMESNFSNNLNYGLILMGKIDTIIIKKSTLSSNKKSGIFSNISAVINENSNTYSNNKESGENISVAKKLSIINNSYTSNGEVVAIGGALSLYNIDSITVDSSMFTHNNGLDSAGAISCNGNGTVLSVENSQFRGNYAGHSASDLLINMVNSISINISKNLFDDENRVSNNLIAIKDYKDSISISENNFYCSDSSFAIYNKAPSTRVAIDANGNFWGSASPVFAKLIYDFYKSDAVSKVDRGIFSDTPITGTPDK